jgi:FlaA1/EpsC-like NDP-sugar epimerase
MRFEGLPQRTPPSYPLTARLLAQSVRLLDPLCVLLAALGVVLLEHAAFLPSAWAATSAAQASPVLLIPQLAWITAALSPFLLRDEIRRLRGGAGSRPRWWLAHSGRFLVLGALALTLGLASHSVQGLPRWWLLIWLLTAWLLTLLARSARLSLLRRMRSAGAMTEVVAVVGQGAGADAVVQRLQRAGPNASQLLGVFDDRQNEARSGATPCSGSVEDLLEIGKTQRIDWILVALPANAESRLAVLVQRLKALSSPIGLCPPAGVPEGGLPSERRQPSKRWRREVMAPRWVGTLWALGARLLK